MHKCGHKLQKNKKKCRKFSIATKNPFNIGVVNELDDGHYLVLLGGNYRGEKYLAGDKLPYWVLLGERPCRKYNTMTSTELVDLWHKVYHRCPNRCNEHITYKEIQPNALLTYTLVNDESNSCAMEIVDAKLEEDEKGNLLALTVKPLRGEGGITLDSLDTHIFNINVSMDGLMVKGKDLEGV